MTDDWQFREAAIKGKIRARLKESGIKVKHAKDKLSDDLTGIAQQAYEHGRHDGWVECFAENVNVEEFETKLAKQRSVISSEDF